MAPCSTPGQEDEADEVLAYRNEADRCLNPGRD
jgi:hypothetical protein